MTAAWDQRDLDEQSRVRDRLLAGWLPTVVASAPYWRGLAERLGITAADAHDLATLRRLPSVRAADLLVDGTSGASAVVAPTEHQVKAHAPASTVRRMAAAIGRGGADGKRDVLRHDYQPLQLQRVGRDGAWWIASSRSDLDRMHRAGARTAAVAGLDPTDVVVSAVRCAPTLEHLGVAHLATGASITAAHPRTGDDFGEVLDAIRALSPTVLAVAADEADRLAEALRAGRVSAAGLRRLPVVGPPPTTSAVRRWQGPSAVATGSVGVRALWGPPGRGRCGPNARRHGLHTYPDLEHLEVVDPFTGAPADADGDLTLTSLGWHGTALVRYRTGAWVDPLTTEPCPSCGRTIPPGRHDRAVRLATALPGDGGDGIVDLRGIAAVLARQPGVVDWRVECARTATTGVASWSRWPARPR